MGPDEKYVELAKYLLTGQGLPSSAVIELAYHLQGAAEEWITKATTAAASR
jgi:hypothetical protein